MGISPTVEVVGARMSLSFPSHVSKVLVVPVQAPPKHGSLGRAAFSDPASQAPPLLRGGNTGGRRYCGKVIQIPQPKSGRGRERRRRSLPTWGLISTPPKHKAPPLQAPERTA